MQKVTDKQQDRRKSWKFHHFEQHFKQKKPNQRVPNVSTSDKGNSAKKKYQFQNIEMKKNHEFS